MNGNQQIIGRCSLCGGVVSMPLVWLGVTRPVARCERCGAVADEAARLPVVPMVEPGRPARRPVDVTGN